MKIKLQHLKIAENLKMDLPLFYHRILYNKLEAGDPFSQTEFSEQTQSLVFFERPGKLISKIIDLKIIGTSDSISD